MNRMLLFSATSLIAILVFSGVEFTHGHEDARVSKDYGGSAIPQEVLNERSCLHLYKNNRRVASLRWESTKTLDKLLKDIGHDSRRITSIYFSPGTYTVESPLKIFGVSNLKLLGSPGTRLVFPPALPFPPRLTREVRPGDRRIYVDRPGFFERKMDYEAFRPDKKGGFQLEFKVAKTGSDFVEIVRPAYYMSHVRSIPAGCLVYKRHNFFEIKSANNVLVEGFEFDGLNVGDVHGHLNYCGILVRNSHHKARRNGAPLFKDFVVQHCSFQNLRGRGVAVYATSGVVIRNCTASHIGAEVFELDHMSSGIIADNEINDSHIAIQVNDAYDSVVRGNIIKNSKYGVTLYSIFKDEWVNINNRVINNDIGFTYIGIKIIGRFNKNILIRDNRFKRKEKAVVGDRSGCIIENNVFD